MRITIACVAFLGLLTVAACKEEKAACTADEAEKKAAEMITKIQELATTNPEKLAAVGARAQELQAELTNATNDPTKACEAVDELMKAME